MGVRLLDTAGLFIGANVYFDELRPERIVIGKNVIITEGTRILSHFYDTHRAPAPVLPGRHRHRGRCLYRHERGVHHIRLPSAGARWWEPTPW